MSLRIAFRPVVRAARPVMPEPAKKSTTVSPLAENASMNGWIAAIGTFVK
jgi:hypothetical protein